MLGHIRSLVCASVMLGVCAASSNAAEVKGLAKVGLDHYRGTWLEIGRTPMFLTDGCVAGYSTYRAGQQPNEVRVEDGCRVDSPEGKLKTIEGRGLIGDYGSTNARMRVRYPFLITFNYWVLYEAANKSWFISATPDMANLWIYSRKVPSKKRLQQMIGKASTLGYDTRKLEFPAQ